MRQLTCPNCRAKTIFESEQCLTCETDLVFNPKSLQIETLKSAKPCANRFLIGCNWSTDEDDAFCRSCRLTRTIPNLGSDRNVVLWKRVEVAKRRLIYDLARLELPLAMPSGAGLSFDILSDDIAGHPIMTGHLAGHITLNLVEADDVEREARRTAMREPYRTLLGHFRHEVGHFCWDMIVGQTALIGPFRLLFGSEETDYQTALQAYHNRSDRSYDKNAFITEYATSHPWEDWAETFAHFLHIVSTLDSAAALPLHLEERARQTLEDPYLEFDFDALLASWTPVSYSMNELNRSMGLNDAYPFQLTPIVRGKLHFVHLAIFAFRTAAREAKLQKEHEEVDQEADGATEPCTPS